MTYTIIKKLILNQNNKYKAGAVDKESYTMWKATTQNKLDVFLTCDRITESQYKELKELLLTV